MVLQFSASAVDCKTRLKFPFSEWLFQKFPFKEFPFLEGALHCLVISFLGNFFGQDMVFKQNYTIDMVSTLDLKGDLEISGIIPGSLYMVGCGCAEYQESHMTL
jgi:hypothetical protein